MPYAAQIVDQGINPKSIENRPWPTNVRTTVGIHASQRIERGLYGVFPELDVANLAEAERLAGHVLGTVMITGCHQEGTQACTFAECSSNPWAMWSENPRVKPMFHWTLDHPRQFVTPIPARGALKFWDPDPILEHRMLIGEYV